MRKFSARSQLIVLGTMIVVSIIAGTVLIISMQRQATVCAFQVAVNNLGNGMSRQTAHFLAQDDGFLKRIQTEVAPSPGLALSAIDLRMRSPAAFDLLCDLLERLSAVDSLLLVGADGKVVNSSQGWQGAPTDLSGQDFFSHFKAHDDPALFAGVPVQDPSSGSWTIPMARRIDGARGQFAGVVVAELSLAELAAFYQLAIPANRTLYLVRRDGIVLLRYPAAPETIGRRIPHSSAWYSVVARGGGVYDAPTYFSPTRVIAAVHPLHNLPFVVEASVTRDAALVQWKQQRIWVLLGGAFWAICAIGVLRLFGRQIHRIETSERTLACKNAQLDIARRRLEATLANLSQGVCFFDQNNKLLVFNQRYCQLLDLRGAEVRVGMSIREIAELRIAAGTFGSQTLDDYLTSVDQRIRAGTPVDEVANLADGRTISEHFEPLAGHGWVATLEDISVRHAAEQKIAYLAHHDLLTGLANRTLLREQLRLACAATLPSRCFSVVYLDLDKFKEVNDTFGHPVGDGLLVAVADRLRATVGAGDSVFRLGGDEFVILHLSLTDQAETISLSRRIVEAIGRPFVIDGNVLSIGVSIGIALATNERMNPERLLQDADQALYRSKREGRGTWSVFEPTITVSANARSKADDGLLHSLSQGRVSAAGDRGYLVKETGSPRNRRS